MKSGSSLLVKSPGDAPGLHRIAGPGDMGLRFLEFCILNLSPKQASHSGNTEDREYALDFFSGTSAIEGTTADGKQFQFLGVGGRDSAFSGSPEMVYLPAGCHFTVRCEGKSRIGIFTAPGANKIEAAYIPSDKAMKRTVGKGNWTRDVVTSIGDNIEARSLLVGETLNPPGNWSSAPPHKHDTFAGEAEVPMEEIYYFQVDPPQGFGLMRVYTPADDPDPLDEALVVQNGETVLIPRGYHPVAAAPGYRVHYTWGMAGQARRYGAWTEDPRHAWVKTS